MHSHRRRDVPGDSNRPELAKLCPEAVILSNVSDLLPVRHGVSIPLSEIELRTSRSSGPGGQHANVTASRVEAVFDVAASEALSDAQRARVMGRLGSRVTAAAQDLSLIHI